MSPGDRLVPLDSLAAGARARVRVLQAADERALLGLTRLGFLPGVRIEILRRAPVLCVSLDGACYAIDRVLARGIFVEVEEMPEKPQCPVRRPSGLL
jgi:Fe2+ transport system protein FeoA